LTFGEICLGCLQRKAKAERSVAALEGDLGFRDDTPAAGSRNGHATARREVRIVGGPWSTSTRSRWGEH
jgi:hypothetical protein